MLTRLESLIQRVRLEIDAKVEFHRVSSVSSEHHTELVKFLHRERDELLARLEAREGWIVTLLEELQKRRLRVTQRKLQPHEEEFIRAYGERNGDRKRGGD